MKSLIDIALLLTALGCGLMAGFFFAFSICVMRALGALPPTHGIAAMQSINVVVLNRWSLTLFLGLVAACVFLMIVTLLERSGLDVAYVIAGSVLYLVGTLLVTMIFNVPRNNALAALPADSSESVAVWATISSPGRSGTMCARSPRWQRPPASRAPTRTSRWISAAVELCRIILTLKILDGYNYL